jgi:hypothetical protein
VRAGKWLFAFWLHALWAAISLLYWIVTGRHARWSAERFDL